MDTFGVDLDGCVNNILEGIIKYSKEMWNIEIAPAQCLCYDLQDCTPLTTEKLNFLFNKTDLFSNLHPMPGARATLGILNASYHIDVVTYRDYTIHFHKTLDWLIKNHIKFDYLHLVGSRDKRTHALKSKISYFVEDRLESALQLSEVCKKVFLIDWPYNQGELPNNVIRVEKWSNILEHLGIIDELSARNFVGVVC